MSGFSPEWLVQREPLDARSRATALVKRLCADAPRGPRRIIDLATGTGANLRYLAPRLGGTQDWLLVDNDGGLLEALGEQLRHWAANRGLMLYERGETLTLRGPDLHCRARRVQRDLADEVHYLNFGDRWLVTASALLDLVSSHWLYGVLARCHAAGARLLFALTYDGVVRFSPFLAEDALVNRLINQHQTRDKGFGPALGPRAAWHAPAMTRRNGYRVFQAHTPWHLGPGQVALQRGLIEAWAQVAVEVDPDQAACISRWRRQRHNYLAAGTSHLCVGHRDLLACLIANADSQRCCNTNLHASDAVLD